MLRPGSGPPANAAPAAAQLTPAAPSVAPFARGTQMTTQPGAPQGGAPAGYMPPNYAQQQQRYMNQYPGAGQLRGGVPRPQAPMANYASGQALQARMAAGPPPAPNYAAQQARMGAMGGAMGRGMGGGMGAGVRPGQPMAGQMQPNGDDRQQALIQALRQRGFGLR